jgi:hypothetical protein
MEAKVKGPRLFQFYCIPSVIYTVHVANHPEQFPVKYNMPWGVKKEMRTGKGEGAGTLVIFVSW